MLSQIQNGSPWRLTSFINDRKLTGDDERSNERAKLKRQTEEKILGRFYELMPEAALGHQDLTITDEIIKSLEQYIEEIPLSVNKKKDGINFLIKILYEGQNKLNWQVNPPPHPFIIKHEFNPLTNHNFSDLLAIEHAIALFENSFLDGRFDAKIKSLSNDQSTAENHEQLIKLIWGRFFFACARFCALLETKSFIELAFADIQINQFKKYVWMDLFSVNETSLQRPLRRFFPEEIVIILWQQIQNNGLKPSQLIQDKDKVKWVESSIRTFITFLSLEFSGKKYSDWLGDMKTWHSFSLPPILMGIASGKQITTAFVENVWLRLISNRKIKNLSKPADEILEDWESTYNFTQTNNHNVNRKYDTEYKQLTNILRVGKKGQKNRQKQNVESNRISEKLRLVSNEFKDPPLILQGLVSWLIKKLKVDRIAKSTAYHYLTTIGPELIDRFAALDILSLDAESFLGVYKEMLENSNEKSSNHNKVQQLQQFHSHLVVHLGIENIDFRLDDEMSGFTNANARFLTEFEFKTCLQKLKRSRENLSHEICELACLLSYRCGLRISEVSSLRLRDLHIVHHHSNQQNSEIHAATLKVRSNPYNRLKTTNANRVLPLHLLLSKQELNWLNDYLSRRRLIKPSSSSEYLFPDFDDLNRPINSYQICNRIVPIMREVTGDYEITFHQLRHTFCCQLFALISNMDVIVPLPLHWVSNHDANHHLDGNLKNFFMKHSKFSRKFAYQVMFWMGHSSPSMSLLAYVHWSDYLVRNHLDSYRIEHQSKINDPLNHVTNTIVSKKIVMNLLGMSDDIYRRLKLKNFGDMKLAIAKRCKVPKVSIREIELTHDLPDETYKDNYIRNIDSLNLLEWINFMHIYKKTLNINIAEQMLYLTVGSGSKVIVGLEKLSRKGSKGGFVLLKKPSKHRGISVQSIDFFKKTGTIFPEPPKGKQLKVSESIFNQLKKINKKDSKFVKTGLEYFIKNFRLDGGHTQMDESSESKCFYSLVNQAIPNDLEINETKYLRQEGLKSKKGHLSVMNITEDSNVSSHGFRYALMMFWLITL